MYIINIFCDASIDNKSKLACGGAIAVSQNGTGNEINPNYILSEKLYLQRHATNNSAEILAIYSGIEMALKLRQIHPYAIFRLFSDSKISLYGLRDWMKNWIATGIANGNLSELKNASGKSVANQEWFIDIYNIIIETNLRIELYHQRGHINTNSLQSLNSARADFIKANKVPPENLGVDTAYISYYNNCIDNESRLAVYSFLRDGAFLTQDTSFIGEKPIDFEPRANMLHKYITSINKTSVPSHHDFKGGYNQ